MTIVMSFIGLCVLLFVGHWLRAHVKFFRILFLPACVIGGLLGLVALETFKGFRAPIPSDWTAGWSKLPGFLINIVFACLFLGHVVPKIKTLWKRAGVQLAYGQVVAWGQYVVGVGLVLLVLGAAYGVKPVFGGLIPVGFEGGHGTAGGLRPAFEDPNRLNWPEGADLAVASATFGIVGALVFGIILVNWAARRGHLFQDVLGGKIDYASRNGIYKPDERPSAGKLTISGEAVESLALHLAVVGIAVLVGYLILQGLQGLATLWKSALPATAWKTAAATQPATTLAEAQSFFRKVMHSFPLFPMCMIGGLIVQKVLDKCGSRILDGGLTRRIQNSALDFLVIAAIATINTSSLFTFLAPFLIIVAAAIAWNVFCVTVLARRMLPDAWFERRIAEMGQSMGVTATGLLLLRLVDPDYESPAADAFACKQILHEPFMGGGLWTSTALPLLVFWGGWPVFWIACVAVALWLVLGTLMNRSQKKAAGTVAQ